MRLVNKRLTRRQIRAIQKRKNKSAVTLRKGTSLLGTAMLVSSLSTPLMNQVASAAEDPTLDDHVDEKQQSNGEHLQKEYELQSGSVKTEESNNEMDSAVEASSETDVSSSTSEENSSEQSSAEPDESTTDGETESEEIIHGSDNGKEYVDNPQAYTNIDGGNAAMMRSYSAPNQQEFIAQLASHAREVAASNDLYASVMIAQAILESGWGSSSLSKAPNYNLFGIKGSYNGNSVTMQTKEYINGKWVTIYDQFRAYPSFRESLQDNARVLKTTSFSSGVYFYSGAWKSNTKSYRDATSWLTGRYATDPSYNTKLNSIIETYQLTQYDTPNSNGGTTQPEENTGGNSTPGSNTGGGQTTPPTVNGETYTVVSGDTLFSISRRFGVTVAQLKSWNHLTSDLIYPGQKLVVKANSGANETPAKPEKPTETPKPVEPTKPSGGANQSQQNNTLYTVVSGDSLYAIGQRYGVSVAQLKSWNQLTSDTIYPGQKLIVKTTNISGTAGNGNQNNGGSSNSNTSQQGTYTVVSGDSLYAIGQRYGVSVAQLKSWNQLSSDLIYPGQKLVIKAGSTAGNSEHPSAPSSGNNTQTAAATYTVLAGDNLYWISQRYGVSIAQLKSWNKLTNDLIFPGQKLIIKGGTNGASTSTNQGNSNVSANYTVKAGDTLYAISLRHNVTVPQLMQWNQLSSPLIFIGQKLVISSGKIQQQASTTNSNQKVHIVKSGDTLWGIGQQYKKSVNQLKQKNQLKSDVIYIGQKILVD